MLAVSVEDDLYGTLAAVRCTTQQIQGARLLSYARGGHAFLGHDEQIGAEISAFLRQHRAAVTQYP